MNECGVSVSADVWGMLYTSARRWRMCTHTPLSRKHFSLSLFLFLLRTPKPKPKIVCVCVCVCVYICLYRKRISRRAAAGQHVLQRNNKAATRHQQGGNKATTRRQRRAGGRSTRRPTKCKLKTDSQSERGLAKKKETFSKPKFNPTRRGSRVARNENCSENQEKETL